MIRTEIHDDGVAEVILDNPPVNALPVTGWFELADALVSLGRNESVRVVVLRAAGRGFNVGVDIKEMQATEGFDALIGANRGCYAAFKAVEAALRSGAREAGGELRRGPNGLRDTMDAAYGLHHLAHAHNAMTSEDYLKGHDAKSMKRGIE